MTTGPVATEDTIVRIAAMVREQFGDDMALYVEQSMRTDPNSPFARMVSDAMLAKLALAEGREDDARIIVATYKEMAEASGFGLQFEAMMQGIGLAHLFSE